MKAYQATSGSPTASQVPVRAAGVRSVRRKASQRPVTMAMMIAGRMIDTAAPYNDKYDASSWRMTDLLGLGLTSCTIVTMFIIVNGQTMPFSLPLSYSR